MTDISGKTAFITGGAKGIGFALATALGKRGANIMIADINPTDLEGARANLEKNGITAATCICDVRDVDAMKAAADATLERFGKVHIVVNNAGVSLGGPSGELDLTDWRWIVDINLLGVANGVETFLPLIQSHGDGGHIVNVASMAGHLASPMMGPYNATKFAVVGYSETISAEVAASGIGVSILCPAFVKTDIHKSGLTRPSVTDVAAEEDRDVFKMATALVEAGIDPDVYAEWAADCIEANRLYVFSEPALLPMIEQRAMRLKADYEACANSPRFAK